jgi:hypothetical protein
MHSSERIEGSRKSSRVEIIRPSQVSFPTMNYLKTCKVPKIIHKWYNHREEGSSSSRNIRTINISTNMFSTSPMEQEVIKWVIAPMISMLIRLLVGTEEVTVEMIGITTIEGAVAEMTRDLAVARDLKKGSIITIESEASTVAVVRAAGAPTQGAAAQVTTDAEVGREAIAARGADQHSRSIKRGNIRMSILERGHRIPRSKAWYSSKINKAIHKSNRREINLLRKIMRNYGLRHRWLRKNQVTNHYLLLI